MPPSADIHRHPASIDAVFQQLFQRSRAFDHLASGNLVDQMIWQR